jgi:2-octaprenyl-6-methoxyphenol hydroxylase
MKQKISIIGCGLSGLTCAIALSTHSKNAEIELIDCKDSYADWAASDIRTIALAPKTIEFFKKFGVWEKISPSAGIIKDIIISDYPHDYSLFFDQHLVHEEELGFIVPISIIVNCLSELVKKSSRIKYVKFNVSRETLKNIQNNSSLVIIADGKNSKLYKNSEVARISYDYKQTASTFMVEHNFSHEFTAYENFYPSGPIAILPLADVNKSSIVWTQSNKATSLLNDSNRKLIEELLYERFGMHLGRFKIVSEIIKFPLKLQYQKEYFHENIIFLGDALHSMHPVAGQGFNQTVRDVEFLSEIYKEFLLLGLEIGSKQFMSKFKERRIVDNSIMIHATHSLVKLFSNNNQIFKKSRNLGIRLVDSLPILKSFFMEYAMGKR